MVTSRTAYRKAAKSFFNNDLRASCEALLYVGATTEQIAILRCEYTDMFKPEDTSEHWYWWGFEKTEESQLARSLALLFMSEMTQDEIENI